MPKVGDSINGFAFAYPDGTLAALDYASGYPCRATGITEVRIWRDRTGAEHYGSMFKDLTLVPVRLSIATPQGEDQC